MAFTTVAKVRERCTKLGANPPDANITNFITHAEGIIKAIARTNITDAQAAGELPDTIATDIAAFYAISFDTAAFTTNSQASLSANMLYSMIALGLELLKDERVVKYITG